MNVPLWAWFAVLAVILVMLAIDLFAHRKAHVIGVREAAKWSAFWVVLGIGFGVLIWWLYGAEFGAQYFSGYVIEKSLSVDNVFVWAVVFSYFGVPAKYQHRVLFWGIFGALVMRAIFIFAGVALLERLSWLLFVFGGLLLFTAWRVWTHGDEEIHPERNPVLRLLRRFVPITSVYDGQRLFTRENGRLLATPLFVALVMVEATDLVFAIDSVPAILAVSRDPFVVFSSNAMAILGLRALYFLLAGARHRLVYLNRGLGLILAYVGLKMLVSDWYHINAFVSLGVILLILVLTIALSLRASRSPKEVAP